MPTPVDGGCRLLAAKYIRKQVKQLAGRLEGVGKAEDIEDVHQARVASRRLRAAMRMFRDCFDAKQLKRWRKEIRRTTTKLGDARDADVQIEFLSDVLDSLEERACRPGIARLLVKTEQKRERLQPGVLKAVGRLQSSGILDEMQAVAKRMLSEAKGREVTVRSPAALDQAEHHVLDNLNRLLPYEESLARPEATERHHAMRIAAKRLRYTVEIAKPLYPKQLDGAVTAIKKLQSLLGDVHDCDVWRDRLDAFAEAQRAKVISHFGHAGPLARLEVGIEHLRQERSEHRRHVFEELADYWQKLNRQGQWDKLVGTVQARGEAPRRPRVHKPLADPQPPAETVSAPRNELRTRLPVSAAELVDRWNRQGDR